MKSFRVKIPSSSTNNDLTIIYKGEEDRPYELKASKDEILRSLQYFQKKRHEINQTNLIYIEEKINFDIFKSFISSINTKEIDLNDQNYEIYYYLCNKYQYDELKQQIEIFIDNRPDIVSVLTDLSQSTTNQTDLVKNSIDVDKEHLISRNIDISIQNGLLKKLPIQMINRILNSPHRIVKNHHLLFSFVIEILKSKGKEKLSKDDEESLSLLPGSLDYCEMSNDEINELFSLHNSENFLFSPRNSNERIQRMISFENEMKEKCQNLEKLVSDISNEYSEKFNSVIKLFDDSQKENKELLKRIEKMEQEQINQKSLIETYANKKNEMIVAKCDDLSNKYSNLNELNNQTKSDILQINSLLDDMKERMKSIECSNLFTYHSSNPFDGIFQFLTNKTGGNIHQNGTIEISCSRLCCGKLETLVDFKNANGFTHLECGSTPYWLKIDFKSYKIEIDSYLIRSKYDGVSGPKFLKSWKFDVSSDGVNWNTIDQRTDVSELNGENKTHLFNVSSKHTPSRFIRIITDNKNWGNLYGFSIGNLEIFGKIY